MCSARVLPDKETCEAPPEDTVGGLTELEIGLISGLGIPVLGGLWWLGSFLIEKYPDNAVAKLIRPNQASNGTHEPIDEDGEGEEEEDEEDPDEDADEG